MEQSEELKKKKLFSELSREELLEIYKNDDREVIVHGSDIYTEYGFVLFPYIILRSKTLSANAKIAYAVASSYAIGQLKKLCLKNLEFHLELCKEDFTNVTKRIL